MNSQTGSNRSRRTQVFGPAYLDRVLRIDRPLVDDALRGLVDESIDGRLEGGEGLRLIDPQDGRIGVELPEDWPGPRGTVLLSRPLVASAKGWRREVRGIGWHDDLGGMGAGFAAVFRGELVSALGADDDPTSRAIVGLLARAGVAHRPIRIAGHPADWTLLITSAEFGDKLPIGFRGCHAAIVALSDRVDFQCGLRVVAALPNRLAGPLLRAPGPAVRFFAPASRNMVDADEPLARFSDAIDFLSCNRREWESQADRQHVDEAVPVLAITDGPRGSEVRFNTTEGLRQSLHVAAFPRSHPPRDTNRAGEAYAAALLRTLLDAGWTPGPLSEDLARLAAERASAAAALEIDLERFGFPGEATIDTACARGKLDQD
ncbi:MAG TPA: sugar kinase [Isosphaeraceae bacterium]|jgi:ribokinase|nr:sugar kinase [Isosphaeraceae bacterium]